MFCREKACVKCFMQNDIIARIDDDPRDRLIERSRVLLAKKEKALKEYNAKKQAYLSSLASTRRIKTAEPTIKQSVSKTSSDDKSMKKQSWSTDRLNILSRPKIDYYEYTEETLRTKRTFRKVNIERINNLAAPRKFQWDVDRSHKCNRKVPLAALMPRLQRLSAPPKRTDPDEHVRTDQDTFSVKKSALKYVATDRLRRLATPRSLYQEN